MYFLWLQAHDLSELCNFFKHFALGQSTLFAICEGILIDSLHNTNHHISSSSSECSAQGQIPYCKRRILGCISVIGRSITTHSGTKAAVLPGMIRCGSFVLISEPTLSLVSEQTLKDLKWFQGHHKEVRRMDLTGCALRTSPKFTTRVQCQFHQDFLPDPRSRSVQYNVFINRKTFK